MSGIWDLWCRDVEPRLSARYKGRPTLHGLQPITQSLDVSVSITNCTGVFDSVLVVGEQQENAGYYED